MLHLPLSVQNACWQPNQSLFDINQVSIYNNNSGIYNKTTASQCLDTYTTGDQWTQHTDYHILYRAAVNLSATNMRLQCTQHIRTTPDITLNNTEQTVP